MRKLLHVVVLESSSVWIHALCIRSPDSLVIDYGTGIRVQCNAGNMNH